MILTHTIEALKAYDKTAVKLTAYETKFLNAGLGLEWLEAWDVAERKVQDAFYEDTKDRNQLCNCRLVSVEVLRTMAAKQETD